MKKFLSYILFLIVAVPPFVQAAEISSQQPSRGLESFQRNVYPLLKQQCTQCHSESGVGTNPGSVKGPLHTSDDVMRSYKLVSSYTNFSDLKTSKLVTKGSNGHGNTYGGNVQITSNQLISALTKWLEEGESQSLLLDKKILAPKTISQLPKDHGFIEMNWSLQEIDPTLSGVDFKIDIQRFMDASQDHRGSYRLKNPRFEIKNKNNLIKVQGLFVTVNGQIDMRANNYSFVRAQIRDGAPISDIMQIVIDQHGEGKDQIGFAFNKIMLASLPASGEGSLQGGKPTELNLQKRSSQKMAGTQVSKLALFDKGLVGVAAQFVKIEPGAFEMAKAIYPKGSEQPVSVTLTKPFEIAATEVTQLQWYLVMKNTPSRFKTQNDCDSGSVPQANENLPEMCKHHPVEQISYNDLQEFLVKLNQMQSDYIYRLPTEAEWEYVARAGLPVEYEYAWGSEFDASFAWFSGNSNNRTHAVGLKLPTGTPQEPAVGEVFDMAGNVWEMVSDWYQDRLPGGSDPQGPNQGSFRVLRGGGWGSNARGLRSAFRNYWGPGDRSNDVGFRLVRTAK